LRGFAEGLWHTRRMSEELSEREKQVAAHIAGGLRVPGIASELCIAEVTVRNHLRNIFSKLSVHSQSELVELLRQSSQILGAHRGMSGLEAAPLVDGLSEVDRATESRLDEVFRSQKGLAALKAVIRAVLPLDEERAREWRTRLAVHAVAPQQRNVRIAFEETRQKWASRPLERIGMLQDLGWVRPELEPDDVRRKLVGTVHAAAIALLADPSPEEQSRQLAVVDELLESLAADDQ